MPRLGRGYEPLQQNAAVELRGRGDEPLQQNVAVELCSVDVWDTLLRRRCHPDAVKLHVAKVLLEQHADAVEPGLRDTRSLLRLRLDVEADQARRSRQAGFDDEYRHVEVLDAWLARALPRLAPVKRAALAQALEAEEVAQEERVSYADPGIAEILDSIDARRWLFVSDFYMSAERLFALLQARGLAARFADGVSSCDVKRNKRSGRLFRHLHELHHVTPSQHLHVGDNPLGDVAVPRKLGMTALHYKNGPQARLAGARARWLAAPRTLFRELERRCVARARGSHDESWRQGLALAPLFAGFAQFIVESARRDSVERLLFCTREGDMFARACEVLLVAEGRRGSLPAPERLEVSRLATFAASLKDGSVEEMQRLWTAFPQQSLRAWALSLGLPEPDVREACVRARLELDTSLSNPAAAVATLLADPSLRGAVQAVIAQKRTELAVYLRTLGLPKDGRVGLVDIGWRGTIQDNLALQAPGIDWRGYYLGLQRFLNPQPPNVRKQAFGPDLNRSGQGRRLFRNLPLMELACSSEGGSVVGYDVDEHGAVRARRREDSAVDSAAQSALRELQRGILAGVEIWAEGIAMQGLCTADLRAPALVCWEKLLAAPPRTLSRALSVHEHDETFGRGRVGVMPARRNWLGRLLRPGA